MSKYLYVLYCNIFRVHTNILRYIGTIKYKQFIKIIFLISLQVTVDSTPEARMPQGRYFHGADILHSKQIIYIYGGLTGAGKGYSNNVLGDFWMFSVVNQRWDEIENVPNQDEIVKSTPPPLAGHTITLIKDTDHEGLLLVGGFSHRNGLHSTLNEFNLMTSSWSVVRTTGNGPIGIYGHSTVFHQASQVLYVFGGFEFIDTSQPTRISNRLYALDYAKRIWSLLPGFSQVNQAADNLPRARFLHSAVTTDRYMVVFGGRTEPRNASDMLIAYEFKCNHWIRLTQDVDVIGRLPIAAYAQAMALDQDTDAIYIVGGWDGSSQSRVSRLTIPTDLCSMWSNSGKYICRSFLGCNYCAKKPAETNGNQCFFFDRSESEVCVNQNGTTLINHGAKCDGDWMSRRNCSAFDTCAACSARWPLHPESPGACKWCEGCNRDRCIAAGEECKPDKYCENEVNSVAVVDSCPSAVCAASDCWSCSQLPNCAWRIVVGEQWKCSAIQLGDADVANGTVAVCGDRCEQYRDCNNCLKATSNEGGFTDCRWSTQLNECISPSYQPMYCTGGVCGLVLTPPEQEHCPEPCNAYTQCATCLRHGHCGWCAKNDTEGDGVCTEGSLDAPADHPAASTCDIIYASFKNQTVIDPIDNYHWAFIRCPPENECINGHHNCDNKSERCVDTELTYGCECGSGYKRDGDKCIPVCSQGCVRGKCVDPNDCKCDFGYVGANCSIQCQCNGHSDCRGPDKLDDCIECKNNTIGAQCDKCMPLFVGDPRNNGECVPCIDYCNGHTDICVARDAEPPVKNMSRSDLEAYLNEGPTEDAVCLRCANQTSHDQCDGCIYGHFRGIEDYRGACRPCQCHGHGDSCDPVTGEKCNCGNNTESDATCSASSSKNSAQQCWMVQCSKCRDSYAGNPIDGHQCYKQITVESKMCFDAKTIDECKKPAPLKPGQTVFFVVQPRFMNVDIRIIVDVTQGLFH